jgi:hypothetical protein
MLRVDFSEEPVLVTVNIPILSRANITLLLRRPQFQKQMIREHQAGSSERMSTSFNSYYVEDFLN